MLHVQYRGLLLGYYYFIIGSSLRRAVKNPLDTSDGQQGVGHAY
jgi:hypothetical protein